MTRSDDSFLFIYRELYHELTHFSGLSSKSTDNGSKMRDLRLVKKNPCGCRSSTRDFQTLAHAEDEANERRPHPLRSALMSQKV